MATKNGTQGTAEPLAALDGELHRLSEATTGQEAAIARAQDAARAARRAREQAEIKSALLMGTPGEVEQLRRAEVEAVAVAEAEERKLAALVEAHRQRVAERPQAEAGALQATLFQLRRDYGPAMAALLAALEAVVGANAKVHQLEERAAALCPSGSALRRAARLSTGASNLGFQRLTWREFLADGAYSQWKKRAAAAIQVPADLSALLQPEPGTVRQPTPSEEYQRGVNLLVGGPQPKAPRQEQPAPRRFRSS